MRPPKTLESASVLWVYGTLIALSAGMDFWQRGHPLAAWQSESAGITTSSWTLGLGFVVFFAFFSLLMVSSFRWAMELEKTLQQILTPFSYFQILLLSLLAGFAEEWFFRGILQLHLGLFLSTLAFGLAHLLPDPRYWLWSALALIAGLVFGFLYRQTNSLFFVSVLHSLLNFLVLIRLNSVAHRAATSSLQRRSV